MMLDQNVEENMSYLLGAYIGMGRSMERELDRITKTTTESNIETWLEEFMENPSKAFKHCQEAMVKELIVFKRANKPEYTDECAEILKKMNLEAIEYLNLDMPLFLHGYHKMQEKHGFN